MLSEAGYEEIVNLEPNALHTERVSEHFRTIDAILERNAMEDVPVQKSRRRRFARRLSRFLEVERRYFLVSARNDGKSGCARFVERNAANREEGGAQRYARRILRLPLRLPYAYRDFFFVNNVAVAQAF